ncbi:MAG: hypothetical protein HQL54_12925 [Magnetococcales bacterium]|nr:hypothetical protein [Magnetococcales bacterium]
MEFIQIIYRENGTVIEEMETVLPLEAEKAYFRLIKKRHDGEGVVAIIPNGHQIAPACYRTDKGWEGRRETDPVRFAQIWADADNITGPTPAQLQGLSKTTKFRGHQMAEIAKVTLRTWQRYWSSNEDNKVPWSAWLNILIHLGYVYMTLSDDPI